MTDELEPTRVYPAGSQVVEWRQELCQHSGRCVKANHRVFNPRRQPWIETEHATEAEIEGAVAQCPSGALRIRKGSES
jgi:uncharacterized Fe-S cluster protein YjdI